MHIVVVQAPSNEQYVIALATFRRLKSLSFTPELDITLATIPVNEFTVEIITSEFPWYGRSYRIRLYDDTATSYSFGSHIQDYDTTGLYAEYDIAEIRRISSNVYRVIGRSSLARLDGYTLKSAYFSSVRLYVLVNSYLGGSYYKSGAEYRARFAMDYTLANTTISGYFPEQTARERLQMACLSVGAKVVQTRTRDLKIMPVTESGTPALIPAADTFYKPDFEIGQPTREFGLNYYTDWMSHAEEPDSETYPDGYVYDEYNNLYWTYEEYLAFTSIDYNKGVDITINGVMCIRNTSVFDDLKQFYGSTNKITMEVINNGQYWPGDKVMVYLDEQTVYQGYISEVDFSFGNQNKAKLTVMVPHDAANVPLYAVHMAYVHHFTDDGGNAQTITLGGNVYPLPNGTHVIRNPDIYVDVGPEVRIFHPASRTTSVTVNGSAQDVTVNYT